MQVVAFRDSDSKLLSQKLELKQRIYVASLKAGVLNNKYYLICCVGTWGPLGATALSSGESWSGGQL